MPRKPRLTPECQKALEDELVELLATGQPPPPGAAELIGNPELVKKLEQRKQESALQNRQMAKHVLSPVGMGSLASAATLQRIAKGANQPALQAELPQLMEQLKNGGTSLLEEMLLGQALQLQTLAATLSAEASLLPDFNQKQTLLNLSLRASNQLRQVVAALNEVKNPRRAVFVRKQMNQLNFAENSKKIGGTTNELLEGYQNGTTTLESSA